MSDRHPNPGAGDGATGRLKAEISRLFARHRLGPVDEVAAVSGGRLNQVLRVNETLILRCRPPSIATGSLAREAAVLDILNGSVRTARVIASGLDDIVGEYIIQENVPGRTLLDAWLATPDVNYREWWLTQWIAAIQAIHEHALPGPGEFCGGSLKPATTWRSYVEGRIRTRVDALLRLPGADRPMLSAVEQHVRKHGRCLYDQPAVLIHRDIHFGNVMVDGADLTAVLDFELAEAGPVDYELDAIYRFLLQPWCYVPDGKAASITSRRFATVWPRLRRAYPAPFQTPQLRVRLGMYALDHALSSMLQAYSGRWRGGAPLAESAAGSVAAVLSGRYGPD